MTDIKRTAPRMNRADFEALVEDLIMGQPAHNLLVEIGGGGKVVVLRWALTGSAERTEKKTLFFSNSPVMLNAALASFTEWHKEHAEYLYQLHSDPYDPDKAYEQHLENAGWQDQALQEQMEQQFGALDYWQAKAKAEGKSLREIEDATHEGDR